jgi:gas vesicle structural protein
MGLLMLHDPARVRRELEEAQRQWAASEISDEEPAPHEEGRLMTTAMQPGGGGMGRPQASGLADVIDTILDKGLVIDAYVRLSLVGIELITIDARVVIASVDTYLRFAEAANRLDISEQQQGLPGLTGSIVESGAKHKTKGALEAAGDKLREFASETSGGERASRRSRRGGD